MNERIQELMEECTITDINLHGEIYEASFDREKFAKLIVQECIDKIKNANMTDLEGPDPDDVLLLVEKQIKEHFGVDS
jgi:hypothetical protein